MSSGKSLVARYLVEHYGFLELAFAARLKEIATEMFNIDVAKKDEAGRSLLQQLADHMRKVDPNVWVRYVLRKIPPTGNVVISDVRFMNEFETLDRMGFAMVRMLMDRPTQEKVVTKTYPGLPLILLDDRSETELDTAPFYYYINNGAGVPLKGHTTPLPSVYEQVDMLMEQLGGHYDK
jgi:hypothetical protein